MTNFGMQRFAALTSEQRLSLVKFLAQYKEYSNLSVGALPFIPLEKVMYAIRVYDCRDEAKNIRRALKRAGLSNYNYPRHFTKELTRFE